MRNNERVTVTMPADQAEAVRRMVEAGGAESVSSYVAEAVRNRLARDEALATLEQRFGRPSEEALAWARRTLGVSSASDAPEASAA
jgi:Arc/MetJ-type ribon-helix-helix transcriptional regulator